MLPPLPRRSDGWSYPAHPFRRISLPRNGCRVGLRIVCFEACSAFTHVTACTLALSPYFVTRLTEGFNHFVTSIVAPVASGWSICRVGVAPTGKAPPFHGARQMETPRYAGARRPSRVRDRSGSGCLLKRLSVASGLSGRRHPQYGGGNVDGVWLRAAAADVALAHARFQILLDQTLNLRKTN